MGLVRFALRESFAMDIKLELARNVPGCVMVAVKRYKGHCVCCSIDYL